MPFVSFLGDEKELEALMMHQSERYQPFGALAGHILTGPSELPKAERETIAAYVSALNACGYCAGTHSAVAKALGMDAALVDALVTDPDNAPVDDKLRPLLAYARKITEAPSKLTQADADAVITAGWNEQTLSDLVAIAALFAMANRLVEGHGFEALPQAMNDIAGTRMAKNGYGSPDDESVQEPTGHHTRTATNEAA
tara:strand:- start:414 stop:1007 length:594 start_codon:yes stop_codon:yes gene_type:complete